MMVHKIADEMTASVIFVYGPDHSKDDNEVLISISNGSDMLASFIFEDRDKFEDFIINLQKVLATY